MTGKMADMDKNRYTDSLDALLERMRKKQDIKKMTQGTAARFRQSFGEILPTPTADPDRAVAEPEKEQKQKLPTFRDLFGKKNDKA